MTTSAGGLLPWSVWFDDREYAPDVRWPQSVTTYRRMQTDAQLKGLLLATTLPIQRMRWEIDPNGARPEVVERTCSSLNLPQVGADTPRPRRRRKRFDFGPCLPKPRLRKSSSTEPSARWSRKAGHSAGSASSKASKRGPTRSLFASRRPKTLFR